MKDVIKKYRKPLKLTAQLLLVAVIVWLMYGRLEAGFYQAIEKVNLFSWQILTTVLIFSIAVMVSGLLWGRLVGQLDPAFRKIMPAESIKVHVLSWLLKYIPGQAGTVLSKMSWGAKNNLSKKVTASSLIYENIFLASSSVLLAIPAVGLTALVSFGEDPSLLIPLVMTIAVIPLLIPGILMTIVNLGLNVLRRKPFDENHVLRPRQIIDNQLLYLLPRIINGIGFVVIVWFFYQPTVFESFQLVGAYALAGIVGILAIFVPSGIGVREAIIIVVAGPIIGYDVAAATAIVARFCATLADVFLALFYSIIRFNNAKS